MITLDISEKDKKLLIEILESSFSEIRMEISNTDNSSYKDQLKKKRNAINKILKTMRGDGIS